MEFIYILSLIEVVIMVLYVIHKIKYRTKRKVQPFILTKKERRELDEALNDLLDFSNKPKRKGW